MESARNLAEDFNSMRDDYKENFELMSRAITGTLEKGDHDQRVENKMVA